MITLEPALTLQLIASTGAAGFAKQNATPNILTWTAPNDGALHRAMLFVLQIVTALETGGQVNMFSTGSNSLGVFAPGAAAGKYLPTTGQFVPVLLRSGDTVTLQQISALTAGGPTTVYAELWAA